jgi:N-acetyl-gamma-glutamyl-phosphate reductase
LPSSSLAPLIVASLAETEDVVVVAASGTSGAGRDAKGHLVGAEVMGDLSAYRVGGHQHVAEICQASGAHSLSMTPVLAPMPRGILATVTARRPSR